MINMHANVLRLLFEMQWGMWFFSLSLIYSWENFLHLTSNANRLRILVCLLDAGTSFSGFLCHINYSYLVGTQHLLGQGRKTNLTYLRHTRTRLDTGFEPGEILLTLRIMCVTPCPERSFLSATNACSSKLENTSAINSSTDRLQLLGKTCRTALQKV